MRLLYNKLLHRCLAWVVIFDCRNQTVKGNCNWKFMEIQSVVKILVQATLPCRIGLVFFSKHWVRFGHLMSQILLESAFLTFTEIIQNCFSSRNVCWQVNRGKSQMWHIGEVKTFWSKAYSATEQFRFCRGLHKEQFYACQDPSALTGLPTHQSRW